MNSREPFVPSKVAYPDVRREQLRGAKLREQCTEHREVVASNVVRREAALGA
jgi:hypothetical protein